MDAAPRRTLAAQPLLVAGGISVHYHATAALDEVDLDVHRGEVHAIVGENGAGKSTLLRSIAGAVQLSAGSIRVPRGARIEWVPQETELPPDLRVSEWLFLARELSGKLGWLRQRAMRDAATAALAALGCTAAPSASIRSLPIVQRKQVQLARALSGQPDLLLLDEPTAVLGQAETEALFSAVRAQRERGAGILYVSHRLDEVLALANRVTVLRDGCRVSTDPIAAVDTATLVRRMVGRDVPPRARGDAVLGPTALDLVNVAVAHVRGVTVAARCGEVVGLAGLVGAGRSEVLEGIAGLRPLRSGQLQLAAAPVLVPEDRASKGLVRTLNLRYNLFLPAGGCLLRSTRERSEAREWIARLRIRAPGSEATIDSLSGGNQQKLLLARALRRGPALLLLDEPTAGVDVSVKAEIHGLIRQLATAGAAIVLASSDLPELLALCDRILVLHDGEVAGVLAASEATEPRLAALMTGALGEAVHTQ
jgi:rhamnose transport system ATP-binding protein